MSDEYQEPSKSIEEVHHVPPSQPKRRPNLDESEGQDKCCDCVGFCVFPQGAKAGRTMGMAIPAFVLMAAGLGGCNFVRVEDLGWGLIWREETLEEDALTSRNLQCTAYDSRQTDQFDAAWKTGVAFAYFAIIITTITAMTTLALSCATFSQRYAKVLGASFLLGAACQALTYVSLASDICRSDGPDCTLSFGAGVTLGSICMTVFCGISALLLQPVVPKRALEPSSHHDAHELHETMTESDETHEVPVDTETGEAEVSQEKEKESKSDEGGWEQDWEDNEDNGKDDDENDEALSDVALDDMMEEAEGIMEDEPPMDKEKSEDHPEPETHATDKKKKAKRGLFGKWEV